MATTKRYRTTAQYLAMVRRMIRGAGRRVAGADPEDLAELVRLREAVDAAVLDAVRGQRAQGITWQSIGDALGVTKQAAILRWAPHIEG